MVNSGVEMDFNVNIFDTRNFMWDVNVNISTLKNRITMLDPDKLIPTVRKFYDFLVATLEQTPLK